MAFEFTDTNFQAEALNPNGAAVVDFWAEWCGPCKLVGPIIDELSSEFGEKVKIGKLNVDTNPSVSMQFGVRSIPTILFIKNGQVVDKQVGAASKATLKQKLEAII
ncbi:MAG: thioredoxin [Saprospiraceae bacterium]|jgi:thioredoxin 1|nr:thioredoxin [Saprospiraceae bacterium]MBK7359886.1 thioredoxin [Saprospiraceae bacterium]MBK7736644.1 thioredoxin [Saprospiraceae bacterium]MBK7911992.1 thioredoxin [Saprospiraceae bacterium]